MTQQTTAQSSTTLTVQAATTSPIAHTVPGTGSSPESSGPSERMMYQLTDLVDNHNKFYLVELWPEQGDVVRFRATWGRVGARPQVKEKLATRREVEKQIAEKCRKGYRPVELPRPQVVTGDASGSSEPAPLLDPKVVQLVEWVFAEAGGHIQSYLAVPVEALSQAQVEEGRRLLAQAQRLHALHPFNPFGRDKNLEALVANVQAYYNSIPTILPARIDRDEVVKRFCAQFSEQEERLNQLEAAIATLKEQRRHPGLTRYQSLGAHLRALPTEDENRKAIFSYIERTQVHGYSMKVRDVFEVEIPGERSAYETNKRGTSRRELLFHGTHNRNVRHILRTGLVCPKTPSHGRMFGNGIYLANKATKSGLYCSSSARSIPNMMLVTEAALGEAFAAPQAAMYDAPPRGFDSVWGKAGYTSLGSVAGTCTLANDEFIVYSPTQQTIRYLVTFDR